jgi:hypothetical protein
MITQIIQILTSDNYYNIHDNIEIAKGKNELPYTMKDLFTKIKRKIKYKK